MAVAFFFVGAGGVVGAVRGCEGCVLVGGSEQAVGELVELVVQGDLLLVEESEFARLTEAEALVDVYEFGRETRVVLYLVSKCPWFEAFLRRISQWWHTIALSASKLSVFVFRHRRSRLARCMHRLIAISVSKLA